MSKNKFTLKQKEMLIRAQSIIDQASVGYEDVLKQDIHSLKQHIESGDMMDAIHLCHRIHSQAGTFGWPLVTEISGWFKRHLEIQQKAQVNNNINRLFLGSLDTVLNNKLKGEGEASIKLLQHIESTLKNQSTK